MFLVNLVKALNSNQVQFAITGGYAVALHGAVRATMDVDLILLLSEKNLSLAEKTMSQLGLQSKIPVTSKEVFHFREEYITKKNLVAWSFVHPKIPTQIVDLLITDDLKDIEITHVNVGTTKVPIVAIEDLIDLKKRAGRAKDQMDIENLKAILNEKKK